MGFGKDGKGVIITQIDEITLLTLADATVLKQDSPLGVNEDFRIIKMEVASTLKDSSANEIPLYLYLANNELTVAEIEQATSASGPINRGNRQPQEHAERAVFLLGGYFSEVGASQNSPLMGADGQRGVITKTIRWTFSSQDGFILCALNDSGAALTTGSIITLAVKYFGVWVT